MATLDFGNFSIDMQDPAALGAALLADFPSYDFTTGAYFPVTPGASFGPGTLQFPNGAGTAVVEAFGNWSSAIVAGEPAATDPISDVEVYNVSDVMNGGATYRVFIGDITITYSTFKAALLAKDLSSLYAGQALEIFGNTFNDTLVGGALNDQLFGFAGNDSLVGGGGNDSMAGMAGADTMRGGGGNDHYAVNGAGDVVVEDPGQGIDIVFSQVSYALPANIDDLVLEGAATINGTGNALANFMDGNAAANRLRGLGGNDDLAGFGGNDRLDGGAGNDTMAGGAGNDTYVQDAVGDRVMEAAGAGVDTLLSFVSVRQLPGNVERLTLRGGADLDGKGNGLNNIIRGNGGDNTLDGRGGRDSLFGHGGRDTLFWGGADTVNGGAGVDRLRLPAGNLVLTQLADDRIVDIEEIGMAGGSASLLRLALTDVLAISSTTDTLRVFGDAADTIDLVGTWTLAGSAGGFDTYTRSAAPGTATLIVDSDMTVL